MNNTIRKKSKPPTKVPYIDAQELVNLLIAWNESAAPLPPVKLVALCFLIPEKLSTSKKFSGYSWLDDMISEAKIDIIKALNEKKYTHDATIHKDSRAFNYFTTVSLFAFLRVIKRENRYAQEIAAIASALSMHLTEERRAQYLDELFQQNQSLDIQ